MYLQQLPIVYRHAVAVKIPLPAVHPQPPIRQQQQLRVQVLRIQHIRDNLLMMANIARFKTGDVYLEHCSQHNTDRFIYRSASCPHETEYVPGLCWSLQPLLVADHLSPCWPMTNSALLVADQRFLCLCWSPTNDTINPL